MQMLGTEAVDVAQKPQRKIRILRRGCDEFQQRLGVVGGDPRVGQLGAQLNGMGAGGQIARAINPQALPLVTTGDTAQDLRLPALEKLLDRIAAGELQHGLWLSETLRDSLQLHKFSQPCPSTLERLAVWQFIGSGRSSPRRRKIGPSI